MKRHKINEQPVIKEEKPVIVEHVIEEVKETEEEKDIKHIKSILNNIFKHTNELSMAVKYIDHHNIRLNIERDTTKLKEYLEKKYGKIF